MDVINFWLNMELPCWKIAQTINWFLSFSKLKFCEASEFSKFCICWKFHLSISFGSKKSPSTLQAGNKLNKPFEKTNNVGRILITIWDIKSADFHYCESDSWLLRQIIRGNKWKQKNHFIGTLEETFLHWIFRSVTPIFWWKWH